MRVQTRMGIIKQHIEKILRLERATVPQKDMVINDSDIQSKTVFLCSLYRIDLQDV